MRVQRSRDRRLVLETRLFGLMFTTSPTNLTPKHLHRVPPLDFYLALDILCVPWLRHPILIDALVAHVQSQSEWRLARAGVFSCQIRGALTI